MYQIKVTAEVYEEFEEIARDYGFNSGEEIIAYILKELLSILRSEKPLGNVGGMTEKEEEVLKKRLESLGYL